MYDDSMTGVRLELILLKVACKVYNFAVLLLMPNNGRGPIFIAVCQLLLPVMAS